MIFRDRRMFFWLAMLAIFGLAFGNGAMLVVMMAATICTKAALEYDEQCGWDQLAGALPYTVPQLVLSKYALGLMVTLIAAALAVAAWSVRAVLGAEQQTYEQLMYIAAGMVASLLLQGMTLPVTVRLGAVRGWLIGMIATALVLTALVFMIADVAAGAAKPIAACAFVSITIALYLLSIALTLRAYRRRYRA